VLILAIILIGMGAGWVAQLVLGRRTGRGSWGEAIVAGLVGSFVFGLLVSLLAGDGLKLKPSGIIGTIIGAVIVLAIWGAIRGKSAAGSR
jgi:uncharacterized membrane protein YeaQ/YmgE (transglycosylase-associated protein family)